VDPEDWTNHKLWPACQRAAGGLCERIEAALD
jgi:hypothetical protein